MTHRVMPVLAIAVGTFLGAVRNRLLLIALFFAVVLIGFSVAAASVSPWEQGRLIIDVGLAASSGFGSIIAVALTISSFAGELRQRTVYPILVRPISRATFVFGKLLGVLAAMELVVTAMMLSTAATVWLFGESVPAAFWANGWLIWFEMAVVCAVALLFSTLSAPVMAACYSAAVLIAGNLSDDLMQLADRVKEGGGVAREALRVAYYILPDLHALSLRTQAANGLPIPDGFLLTASSYGFTYALTALAVAALIFSRRTVF